MPVKKFIEQKVFRSWEFYTTFLFVFIIQGYFFLPKTYMIGFYLYLILLCLIAVSLLLSKIVEDSRNSRGPFMTLQKYITILFLFFFLPTYGFYWWDLIYTKNNTVQWKLDSFEYGKFKSLEYPAKKLWGSCQVKPKIRSTTGAMGCSFYSADSKNEPIYLQIIPEEKFEINYNVASEKMIFSVLLENEDDEEITNSIVIKINPKSSKLVVSLKDFKFVNFQDDYKKNIKHLKINYKILPSLDYLFLDLFSNQNIIDAYLGPK